MAHDADEELFAEIESFRAELRRRSEEHERRMKAPSALDLPAVDIARLELPQMRALIAERYEHARYERRLREVEKRLADIEARDG